MLKLKNSNVKAMSLLLNAKMKNHAILGPLLIIAGLIRETYKVIIVQTSRTIIEIYLYKIVQKIESEL